MSDASKGGTSFGRLKQIAAVVAVAVVGLVLLLRFALPFAGAVLRLAAIPLALLVLIGIPLGVGYLFSSTDQVYDAQATGNEKRDVGEPISLSPDDTCFVCDETTGDGVRHHEYTEWVLKGHPLVERSHQTTVYCSDHYDAVASQLDDLHKQFDHDKNAQLQEEMLEDK